VTDYGTATVPYNGKVVSLVECSTCGQIYAQGPETSGHESTSAAMTVNAHKNALAARTR
jgi:hypothetical protein